MPRLSDHPIPKKRFHGGRWRIYWKWNRTQYSVATPYTDRKKLAAVNIDLRLFSAALAMDLPIFPAGYSTDPTVKAYLAARFPANVVIYNPEHLLEDYLLEITGECSPAWVRDSISRLRELEAEVGDLNNLTPDKASLYLAKFVAKHKPATRNRTLSMFSRFYKWAVRTNRIPNNPFSGIKTLAEERSSEIVYCTPEERKECISLAIESGWPEWLAVPIAFYTCDAVR